MVTYTKCDDENCLLLNVSGDIALLSVTSCDLSPVSVQLRPITSDSQW